MLPTYNIEKRLTLAEALLRVLESPSTLRVIVSTEIPNLNEPWEEDNEVYYMIDKSDGDVQCVRAEDGSLQECKSAEIFDDWHVSDNLGNGSEFPSAADVLNFFDRLKVPVEIKVESF